MVRNDIQVDDLLGLRELFQPCLVVSFPATDKLQFIFDQIKHFIEAAENEHVQPITGYLPIGLEEHMDVRQHTSVTAPCPLMRERVPPLSRRFCCLWSH